MPRDGRGGPGSRWVVNAFRVGRVGCQTPPVTDVALLAELNEQVWDPFRAAYAATDGEGYLALHDEGLIRAGGPRRLVQSYRDVAAETLPFFADARASGTALSIEFRFLERLADGNLASERGVSRIGVGTDVFYGRFHTFCRKVDRRWRIAVDYDTNEGADENVFAAATAAADLSSYR